MIVNDLNIGWAIVGPTKANAILLIDSDAVLSFTVAGQSFKSIARWNLQLVQPLRGVQLVQFSCRDAPQLSGTTLSCGFRVETIEDILGAGIGKGLDHPTQIACATC
jgi:hypothetical protein